MTHFMPNSHEKPLDTLVVNGGFCGIFRKIACIGDSLSSGEFESLMNGKQGYHDYFDYSWGQYLARDAGCTVYNFSRGGMSAKQYCTGFADFNDYWNIDYRSQAYILALGVNDVTMILNGELSLGSIDDIDPSDWRKNKDSFAGWYGQIIQRYKEIQPKAKFFLMTIPCDHCSEQREYWNEAHAALLRTFAEVFDNCYVLDLRQYGPDHDSSFKQQFYLGGHLNAAGYRLTALMVESYIDYIIRNNMDAFKQIGFIGTPYLNESELW